MGPVRRRPHPARRAAVPRRSAGTPTGGRAGSATTTLRAALAAAAPAHLPDWPDKLTPHVLRHFCASQLYLNGMDLIAIQEALGHAWVATTMRYVHVHRDPRRGRLDRRPAARRRSGWKD